MIRSFLLVAAVLLVASLTRGNSIEDEIPKPQGPFTTMFMRRDMHEAIYDEYISKKSNFFGTYKGKFSNFGSPGSYDGKFNGVATNGHADGVFDGNFTGTCDMSGSKGKYFGKYGGKFASKHVGKKCFVKASGPVTYTYMGTYAGQKTFAKAAGRFSFKTSPLGFIMKEHGTFNMRIGPVEVKGAYKGYFDGKWIAGEVKGTVDGKKFHAAYKFSFEDFEKYITNKGSYNVTSNGDMITVKFDLWDFAK